MSRTKEEKQVLRPQLAVHLIARAVADALAEDLGLAGDITTDSIVSPDAHTEALLCVRGEGVMAGLTVAEAAFRALDPEVSFAARVSDGDRVAPGTVLAHVAGKARALLSAERVALNYLGHMSGIATLTRRFVDAVAGTGAAIVETRKTTPGLRVFEKYAVRCGGGMNHRAGLYDAVLIKDNHIVAAGGLSPAIRAVRARTGHMVKIEVEVDTLDQLSGALTYPVDAVLLDNMTPDLLRKAVEMAKGRAVLEASGGVSLANVRAIAETGVDLISIGALTHSAPVLDIGLDFASSPASKPAPLA